MKISFDEKKSELVIKILKDEIKNIDLQLNKLNSERMAFEDIIQNIFSNKTKIFCEKCGMLKTKCKC